MNILVCIKQVIDPEIPSSSLRVDDGKGRLVSNHDIAPIINGFDENALEAALRIKDCSEANVSVLSIDSSFDMNVIKKPLSLGANRLFLVEDDSIDGLDANASAYVLSKAIEKIGPFDLILCGRQASDWDNGQVPLGISEMLRVPCISNAQQIKIDGNNLIVEKVTDNGYQLLETTLPALITISNEFGELRYPALRGILASGKMSPTIWSLLDLCIDQARLAPKVKVTSLTIPEKNNICEFVTGQDEVESGRLLALRLRDAKIL